MYLFFETKTVKNQDYVEADSGFKNTNRSEHLALRNVPKELILSKYRMQPKIIN